MANGRLGSTTVAPYNAALVYSNTSGSAAAVNVQATSLSTTTNAKFSYAIDSATISVNQITVATAISAGNVDWRIWWLDPVSRTTPVKYMFTNKTQGDGLFTSNYWDGSAWTTSGSAGNIGNFQGIKLDPYFFTNYSEYNGKTAPIFFVPLAISGNNNSARVRSYNLNSGVTGLQLGKILLADDTNGATAIVNSAASYQGCGQDTDLYTDFTIGCDGSPYMSVFVGSTQYNPTYTSNSIMYQFTGGNSIASYYQYWYAQRFLASNGFYVCQASGWPSSYFAICDQETATASGSPNNSFYWGTAASGAKWSGFYGSGTGYEISWFEWNPNTQRFYMEYVGSGTRRIFSASKAELRALQNGNASYSYITALTLEAATIPWATGGYFIMRPRRIGTSLWAAISNNNVSYVSTDLVIWQTATSYWASQGLPATTTTFNGISATSYLYLGDSVANVNQFTSGFSSVSQNALVENQTTFSNYQRTGLVLSAGDKLYCQNYGAASYSIYVMGYEG
jgi:hypothetical protein